THPNIAWHFIESFFRFDPATEEQFALRIFGREQFFPTYSFQLHLSFAIAENDRRFAKVDLRRPQPAVILAQNTDLPRGATGIFPRASRRLVSFDHCSTN